MHFRSSKSLESFKEKIFSEGAYARSNFQIEIVSTHCMTSKALFNRHQSVGSQMFFCSDSTKAEPRENLHCFRIFALLSSASD